MKHTRTNPAAIVKILKYEELYEYEKCEQLTCQAIEMRISIGRKSELPEELPNLAKNVSVADVGTNSRVFLTSKDSMSVCSLASGNSMTENGIELNRCPDIGEGWIEELKSKSSLFSENWENNEKNYKNFPFDFDQE